jgi:hypothetical protein
VALAPSLSGCGGASDDAAKPPPSAAPWPATSCADLNIDGASPRTGRCTEDGRRTLIVARTAVARAGALSFRVVGRPAATSDGTLRVVLEVTNDADGPRELEPDATLSGAGTAVPFLPRSSVSVVGEPRQTAIESRTINPSVPVRFDLRYDDGQIGGTSPRVLRQSTPGARPDGPQAVAFALGRTPSTDGAGSRVRTAPSRLPGRRVTLPGARAVMPPGWAMDRDASAALERGLRSGSGSRPRYATAWTSRIRSVARTTVALSVIRAPGAGEAMERDPSAALKRFGEGVADAVRGTPDGMARLLPGTELGGRTAGVLVTLGERGSAAEASRLLIGAQGDLLYVVAASGPLMDDRAARGVLARIRRSWSWADGTPAPLDVS